MHVLFGQSLSYLYRFFECVGVGGISRHGA
jgi:hypothetical protein